MPTPATFCLARRRTRPVAAGSPHSFLECSRREQHDSLFPLIGQRLPGELEAANTTGWSIKDSVNEAQPAQSANLRRG